MSKVTYQKVMRACVFCGMYFAEEDMTYEHGLFLCPECTKKALGTFL